MESEKNIKEKDPLFRRFLNFFVLKPLFKWIFKVEIKGIENIPSKGKSAIVSGNHVGSFDAASIIEGIDRHIFYLGKKELLDSKFGRFAVKNYGIIPVNRKHVAMGTFKELEDKIEEGRLVGIYPEGTKRGVLKGKKLKSGAVAFSLKYKISIIPVGFDPKFKPFKINYINIGKPINFAEIVKEDEDISDKIVLEKYTNYLMDEIIKLLDEDDQKLYYNALSKRNENLNLNN